MSVAYKSDVVIAGAGVGGLSLALRLAKSGYRVRVLQEQVAAGPMCRPEIIQPAGLQAFADLGLLERLRDMDLTRVERFEFHRIGGGQLCQVDYRMLNYPYPYALVALREQSRRVLLEGLRTYPEVQIHWGTRLTGVLRCGFRVLGAKAVEAGEEREFHASVTVGADGSASRLRSLLGIAGRIKRYPNAFIGIMLKRRDSGRSDAGVRYYMGRGQILGCFPCSHDKLCLLFMVPNRREQDAGGFGIDGLKDHIATIQPELREPLNAVTGWDQVSRLAPVRLRLGTWVVNGAALLGDAAHACHPHVAQGSFQAMEDARVLADVLETSCFTRGTFSAGALKPYEDVRRPVMERLQRVADEYAWLWETKNLVLAWLRDRIFRNIGRQPALLHRVAAVEAGIGAGPLTLVERFQALGLGA
jgi:2-polyprenyl-6-methoxyphenol hydroxylase-like FAD-dependent oxidoreductase